jgi:beta-mannosidase
MEISPQDGGHGNRHVWDVWHGGHWTNYYSQPSRFCSEFGFQGPPAWATLAEALPAEELRVGSDGMLHHQKCPGGNEKINASLAVNFDVPDDFDDWHYLGQVNQARALQCGVEFYRASRPTCMGTIYWQLNDCWPVTSWSAIDGAGRRKPLWYATRRFFAPRLLTFQPRGERLFLFADNDTDETWREPLRLRRVSFDGRTLAEREIGLDVPPRTNAKLLELDGDLAAADPAAELLVADAARTRATWFFDADKLLRYPEPKFEAELEREGDLYRLAITAETLLREVCVFADRLDPAVEVSDQLVTLLPGESCTLEIRSGCELSLAALTAAPVFRCVNRFGRG